MICFNIPPSTENELEFIKDAISKHKISGDGEYTKKCSSWFENRFRAPKVLLTTSGTAALEMAAFLSGINKGDEIILPSYTFSSTANAFVLVGAKLVFVDIRPDTMNIDESLIEKAITKKTKAICVVHYAGVSCEMNKIVNLAIKYNLKVIEDAAQAVMSKYNDEYLGTIGDFGCFSFHETKNYSMGEGGALVIKDPSLFLPAEILREKGTNRAQFFRGEVAKYNWCSYGSSYLPSELNAAYLYPQLLIADQINDCRLNLWNNYYKSLEPLQKRNLVELPNIPIGCKHNAHIFYIKLKDITVRSKLIKFLKENGIQTVFHYVPLHSSPAGLRFGIFSGKDNYTTNESERLLRLPLYYNLKISDQEKVVDSIYSFFLVKR